MNQHSFSLSSIGMTKGRALVKLDGEDISDAVRGIGFDFTAREHPKVMLELADISADVAVDDVEIQLPAKTVALLQQLGWVSSPIPDSDEAEDDRLDLLINLSNRFLAEAVGGIADPPDRVRYAATQLREHLAQLGVQDPGAPLDPQP